MSEDIGNSLPDDLHHLLWEADPAEQHGKAIIITTVDAGGWAHPALLSYREVGARDRTTLRVVTFAGSTTTKNMRTNGKLTMMFIDERMTYYVKGTAKEVPAERTGASPHFATMDVAIHQILKDGPGAGEEGAFITSGVRFNESRPS
jgi:hypothetical protein